MVDIFLQTKLYAPRPRPSLVSRPHLHEKLNRGLLGGLSLVAAPPGFGKTMLIADWGRRLSESSENLPSHFRNPRLCWLSIDEADNDPARFFAYLVAALQTVDQAVGQSTGMMLQAPPAPAEFVMTVLINDVIASQHHFVLVLDDYHLIVTTSIHQVLTYLIENLPPNMHLVITSRADPPFPLARWRAQGKIAEIRQADLQFTAAEAHTFLQERLGSHITVEQANLLVGRTEGWIAGLQLAVLALQAHLSQTQQADADSFLRRFTGDDRYVLDYLSDEVLQQQLADVQAFLLQTSILKRLNGALADAVTGRGDSGQLLMRLEQANLFLVPLDNQRRWYRYHQLFTDVLHSRLLNQNTSEEIAVLHARAATWYENNGLMSEAIEHALVGRDFARAGRLVALVADTLMYRLGEVASLQRWLAALPPDQMNAQPQLWLILAWMQLWTTQPDAVAATIQAALDALPPSGQLPTHVQGQIATLRAQVAAQRGEAESAITQGKKALSHLEAENGRLRGLALAAMGSAYGMRGQVSRAAEVFSEATNVFQAADMLIPTMIALTHRGELQVAQGHLQQAETIFRQTLQIAADHNALKLPAAGGIYIALGDLLREWNDLEQAADYVEQGIELCRGWPGFAEETLAGLLSLSNIAQAQGNAQSAIELLGEAETLVRNFGIAHWQVELSIHRARLWLMQGHTAEAARWAVEQVNPPSNVPILLQEKAQLTLAHVHLFQGAPSETVTILAPLLPLAEADGRIGASLEMLLLQALAHYQVHHLDQALMLLNKALSLAEPGGYVRLFLAHGLPMTVLLERALASGVTTEYIRRLLAAFQTAEQVDIGTGLSPSRLPAHNTPLLVEPLTEREREVLELISAGLSNPEIAHELVIAVTTVKTHAKNIYGKLNVHNRFQAIERARELNLIS